MNSKHSAEAEQLAHSRDAPHLTLRLWWSYTDAMPIETQRFTLSPELLFLLHAVLSSQNPGHWTLPEPLAHIPSLRAGSQICSHVHGSCSMVRLQLNCCGQPCPRVSNLKHMPQLVSSLSKKSKITKYGLCSAL